MKLGEYAKQQGVHYRTAYRWFHAGRLKGRQMETGTILVDEPVENSPIVQKVAIYTRVSSSENKSNLNGQADRLVDYCAQGRRIEVVNLADNGKEELMQDLVSIVYSFSARMYGPRRAKRKTEIIVKELQDNSDATS